MLRVRPVWRTVSFDSIYLEASHVGIRPVSTITESSSSRRFSTRGAMIMTRPVFRGLRRVAMVAGSVIMLTGWLSGPASAASARELDAGVDDAIVKFEKEVKGGKSFLDSSKGML